MLLFNKHFKILSTWFLVLSLSIHFFFIHGMLDFNVICFEEDGSTNFEYSYDGKTCIEHNDRSVDNRYSFTSVESNSCKDISFSASNHNDDQIIVKKFDELIINALVICTFHIDFSSIKNSTREFSHSTTIQSNSIQQLKTVSLLI